jgi:hypothetical protein
MWCIFSPHEVIEPSSFQEETVNSTNYLDILQLFAVSQMAHLQPKVLFQQDGASPQWDLTVQASSNITFPNRWIARD